MIARIGGLANRIQLDLIGLVRIGGGSGRTPHRPWQISLIDACSLIHRVDGEDEVPKDRAAPIVGVLAEFLRCANPRGYRATPKPNSITNKRRVAKGKAPLIYDWHTVVIEPAKPIGKRLGGTHASPRQHERRGHWRTCANGKRVCVRHCIVGDASRGTIFKDYKICSPQPVD